MDLNKKQQKENIKIVRDKMSGLTNHFRIPTKELYRELDNLYLALCEDEEEREQYRRMVLELFFVFT
tara:strand:- start:1318 stop:1518 length:201 start_codon:yes stop_codon:yes gene_type:complete